MMLSAVVLLLPLRVVVIPAGTEPPAAVECPVGQTTRVVFPEALRTLRVDARTKSRLGLVIEQSSPIGIVAVRPAAMGADGTLEFQGPTMTVVVRLHPSPAGTGGDVRLVRDAPPAAATATESAPLPAASAAPTAEPVEPRPEMGELLQAQAVPVGRREGLPGEYELVLVDALKGRSSVWLRFRLEGGAGERVDEVSWEQGRLDGVVQEATGKDLQIVVPLPREGITKRSVVSLRSGGRTYEFSFSAAAFRGLLKALEK